MPKFDRIVYDVEKMRPACVLLQTIYGADSAVAHLFDTNDWLLAPTENMRLYRLDSDEQLQELVKLTRLERQERNEKS